MSFFDELKRRNVVKVGIAYAVATWILLQLTDVVAEILQLPAWAPKLILLILVIGFIPALIFAWAFEMTPEGIKRDKDVDRSASIAPKTGRKLDYAIIGLLALGMAYFVWESRFSEQGSGSFPETNTVAADNIAGQGMNLTPSDEDLTPTPVSNKSIAVLPFTNRSPNANDAYFTDGIHDDLLTQLAKIDAFSVISRTSVMEYRDTLKNLKQIGQELGVANIMEGSVQRSGSRVRINVQLIDANSDKHLWAEVYDRQLTTENLFDIQSEIAQAIAAALHATLSESELASVADVPTDNIAAYELYLQGRRFQLGSTDISFATARDLYRKALQLDPNFKLAWIGLAEANINNYWSYGGDPADRDAARAAIDKARAIDADFPELYMAEGFYHYWGLLDYAAALTYLEKTIALMPGNAEAYMWKGWASRRAGLWEQALTSMQQSLKLNPRVVINWVEYAQTLGYLGRHAEAVAAAEKAYALDPDDYWGKTSLATMVMAHTGDTSRATTLLIGAQHTNEPNFRFSYWATQLVAGQYDAALQSIQNWPADWEIDRGSIDLHEELLAYTLKVMGRDVEAAEQARAALRRLAEMQKQGLDDYRITLAKLQAYAILGKQQKVAALERKYIASRPVDAVEALIRSRTIAQSFALAGMHTECIETLEHMFSGPNDISVPYLELDPAFNSLREDPEFIALLERHR